MPDDVAVHEPRAGVIGLERDDGPALSLQHCGVAARRARKVQLPDHAAGVEGAEAHAKQREVVAVQVHRVRGEELVLDDEIDPSLRAVEDQAVLSDGKVLVLREVLQGGVRPIDVHTVARKVPAEDRTIVGRRDDVGGANGQA